MADYQKIQNGSRIDADTFKDILNHIRLRVTEDYEFPPEIVRIEGTTIATLGNFSASTGKPKSKKTFNVSAIVAAALSGKEILQYKASLPPGKKKILYIDTEQSKCHCHKVLQRILKLGGLPIDQENENIEFFVLREYSPDQRRDIINCALQSDSEIGLVVIDGIRDLIRDINSPSESLDVVNDLMRWSSHYELHIHTVLHLNKADDNTRGHIGTELNNKAETILKITKCTNNEKMSEVRAMHIRDKEFKPFAFQINEEALPVLVKNYDGSIPTKSKLTFTDLNEAQHRAALDFAFPDINYMGYQDMLDGLKRGYESIGFSRGRNIMISLSKFLQNHNAIIKTHEGYMYNPNFILLDD